MNYSIYPTFKSYILYMFSVLDQDGSTIITTCYLRLHKGGFLYPLMWLATHNLLPKLSSITFCKSCSTSASALFNLSPSLNHFLVTCLNTNPVVFIICQFIHQPLFILSQCLLTASSLELFTSSNITRVMFFYIGEINISLSVHMNRHWFASSFSTISY